MSVLSFVNISNTLVELDSIWVMKKTSKNYTSLGEDPGDEVCKVVVKEIGEPLGDPTARMVSLVKCSDGLQLNVAAVRFQPNGKSFGGSWFNRFTSSEDDLSNDEMDIVTAARHGLKIERRDTETLGRARRNAVAKG